MAANHYDAIIIGGHKRALQYYLARAGRKVVVLVGRAIVVGRR